ncbi:uncharacterized protein LOC143249952 isoform X2 [Tachypleus tridentatus]|uniref:uncharacterized protein LOC143249952 isoform X2 n=1 Tax=Tachypleus tridentatus TaxID=6853 RepID=UPI003FD23F0F
MYGILSVRTNRASKVMPTELWLLCSTFLLGFVSVHTVFSSLCSPETEISCRKNTSLCIPLDLVNDGKHDCPDGSDEAECSNNEFQCRSSLTCIPDSQVQDGSVDCLDGSDEECASDQYRCYCGYPRCISRRFVGDGFRDCIEGSDEDLSGNHKNYICSEKNQLFLAPERIKRQTDDAGEDQPSGIEAATVNTTEVYDVLEDGSQTTRTERSSTSVPSPTIKGSDFTPSANHDISRATGGGFTSMNINPTKVIYPSSFVSSTENTITQYGTTTVYTIQVQRKYIDGTFAHVMNDYSSILNPTSSYSALDGLHSTSPLYRVSSETQIFGSLTSGKVYQTAIKVSSRKPLDYPTSRDTLSTPLLNKPNTHVLMDQSRQRDNVQTQPLKHLKYEEVNVVPSFVVTDTFQQVVTESLLEITSNNSGTSELEMSSVANVNTNKLVIITSALERSLQPKLSTRTYIHNDETPEVESLNKRRFLEDITSNIPYLDSNTVLHSTIVPGKYTKILLSKDQEVTLNYKDDEDINMNVAEQPEVILSSTRRFSSKHSVKNIDKSLEKPKTVDKNRIHKITIHEIGKVTAREANRGIPEFSGIRTLKVTSNGHENSKTIAKSTGFTAYKEQLGTVLDTAGTKTVGKVGTVMPINAGGATAYPEEFSKKSSNVALSREGKRLNIFSHPAGLESGRVIITDRFYLPPTFGDHDQTHPDDEAPPQDLYFQKYLSTKVESSYTGGNLQEYLLLPSLIQPHNENEYTRITKTISQFGPVFDPLLEAVTDGSTEEENIHLTYPYYHTKHEKDESFDARRRNTFPTIQSKLTLYGFLEFSTTISGTEVIFLPSVTEGSGTKTSDFKHPSRLTNSGPQYVPKESIDKSLVAHTYDPMFGTQTRQFISQRSMSTSTYSEAVDMMKTVSTSTIITKATKTPKSRQQKNLKHTIETSYVTETIPVLHTTMFLTNLASSNALDTNESVNKHRQSRTQTNSEKNKVVDNNISATPLLTDVHSFTVAAHPTGFITSLVGTDVNDSTTIKWKSLIFGTYIKGTYAHLIKSTSSILIMLQQTEKSFATKSIDPSLSPQDNWLSMNQNKKNKFDFKSKLQKHLFSEQRRTELEKISSEGYVNSTKLENIKINPKMIADDENVITITGSHVSEDILTSAFHKSFVSKVSFEKQSNFLTPSLSLLPEYATVNVMNGTFQGKRILDDDGGVVTFLSSFRMGEASGIVVNSVLMPSYSTVNSMYYHSFQNPSIDSSLDEQTLESTSRHATPNLDGKSDDTSFDPTKYSGTEFLEEVKETDDFVASYFNAIETEMDSIKFVQQGTRTNDLEPNVSNPATLFEHVPSKSLKTFEIKSIERFRTKPSKSLAPLIKWTEEPPSEQDDSRKHIVHRKTTYYTTYTYLTTYQRSRGTSVRTRKKTVTNVLTVSGETSVIPTVITSAPDIKTLYTYYPTISADESVISSSLNTVTNIKMVHSRAGGHFQTQSQPTEIIPSQTSSSENLTTLTSYITLFKDNYPVITTVVPLLTTTPIMMNPDPNGTTEKTGGFFITSVKPFYTTYTFFTTFFIGETQSLSTHEETVTRYKTLSISPKQVSSINSAAVSSFSATPEITETFSPQSVKHHEGTSSTTPLVTYTIFTTLYVNGSSIVTSNTVVKPDVPSTTRNSVRESQLNSKDLLKSENDANLKLNSQSSTVGFQTSSLLSDNTGVLEEIEKEGNIRSPVLYNKRKLLYVEEEEEKSSIDLEKEQTYSDLTARKNDDLFHPYVKVNSGLVERSVEDTSSEPDEDYQKENDPYPTGLIQSMEAKEVIDGVTTVYATEVYGTFIDGAYAQIVQSAVKVYSESPNAIDSTGSNQSPQSTAVLGAEVHARPKESFQKVGLLSSYTNSEVNDQTTTFYTTNLYGTYVGDIYAHIAHTTSSVQIPESSKSSTGLISSSTSSEVHGSYTTFWVTQLFGTYFNGFYAHVASTFSSVQVSPTKTEEEYFIKTLNHLDYSSKKHHAFIPDFKSTSVLPSIFGSKESIKPSFIVSDSSRETNRNSVTATPSLSGYKTGLLSSYLSTALNTGVTTLYTTNIYGTYIGGIYAQIAETTSEVQTAAPTSDIPQKPTGLLSSLVSSEVHDETVIYYTTQIYGTYFGDYYGQVAKTVSRSVVQSIEEENEATVNPSVAIQHETGLISSVIISSVVYRGTTTLHVSEIYGTYIGSVYAHVAKSTTRVLPVEIIPSNNTPESTVEKAFLSRTSHEDNLSRSQSVLSTKLDSIVIQSGLLKSNISPSRDITSTSSSKQTEVSRTGLISTIISTEINDGTTTLHTSEIYGTYIGGFYAHIGKKTSQVLPKSEIRSSTPSQTVGVISSNVMTEINEGITTLHTKEIIGTYFNGLYAHVARETSSVIEPSTSEPASDKTGLISSVISSEIHGSLATIYTKEIHGTYFNGFYAHVARSSFHVVPVSTYNERELTSKFTKTLISSEKTFPSSSLKQIDETRDISPVSSTVQDTFFVSNVSGQPDKFDVRSKENDTKQDILLVSNAEFRTESRPSTTTFELSEEKNISTILTKSINSDINTLESSYVQPEIKVDHDSNNQALTKKKQHEKTTVDYLQSEKEDISKVTTQSSRPFLHFPSLMRGLDVSNEEAKDTVYDGDYTDDSTNESLDAKEEGNLESEDDFFESFDEDTGLTDAKIKKDNDYYEDYYDNYDDNISQNSKTKNRQAKEKTRIFHLGQNRSHTSGKTREKSNNISTSKVQVNDNTESHDSTEDNRPQIRIRPFRQRKRPSFLLPTRPTHKPPAFNIRFRRPILRRRIDSTEEDTDEQDTNYTENDEAYTSPLPSLRSRFRIQGQRRKNGFQFRSRLSESRFNHFPSNNRRSTFSSQPQAEERSDYDDSYLEEDNITEDYEYTDDIEENSSLDRENRFRPLRSTLGPRNGRRSRLFGRRNAARFGRRSRRKQEKDIDDEDVHEKPNHTRNARIRLRRPKGRRSRNRGQSLRSSFNAVSKEDPDEDGRREVRFRGQRRRPTFDPRSWRKTLVETSTSSLVTPTQTPVTVTSVITTVKILPIYHGFKTSYATLTTTTFGSSVIQPSEYSAVTSDGITKTIYSSKTNVPDINGPTDQLHTTITEILITTSPWESTHLVTLKIGYSTRTDTITDTRILTTLSTILSTISPEASAPSAAQQQFPVPFYQGISPNSVSYITSSSSFVTTKPFVSTRILPLVIRGRTRYRTLTTTTFSETTIVTTTTILVPQAQVQTHAPMVQQPYFPFPQLTTELTFYVSGADGRLKPVVTQVAVPFYQQPVLHTKVARSLQTQVSWFATKTPDSYQGFTNTVYRVEDDTHSVVLLSSGLEGLSYMSDGTDSKIPTEMLKSLYISVSQRKTSDIDLTTIFKGKLTEIYEASAIVKDSGGKNNDDEEAMFSDTKSINDIQEQYGVGLRFNIRKLHQSLEDDKEVRISDEHLDSDSEVFLDNYDDRRRNFGSRRKKKNQEDKIFGTPPEEEGFGRRLPKDGRDEEESDGTTNEDDGFTKRRRVIIRKLRPLTNVSRGQTHSNEYGLRRTPVVIKRKIPRQNFSNLENVKRNELKSALNVKNDVEKTHQETKGENTRGEAASTENVVSDNSEAVRRIIRIRRPGSGKKRKVVVTKRPNAVHPSHILGSLQPRGPITNDGVESHEQRNAVDSDLNRVFSQSVISKKSLSPLGFITSADPEKLIPFTYYTTYTYFTTFLHGTDTVYTSRETVLSNVFSHAPNSDVVKVIQSNGGYTVPPSGYTIIPLGSRTGGGATTIVHLGSRLQIFNSDIYSGVFQTASVDPPRNQQSPNLNIHVENLDKIELNALASLPRTYFTFFTYFYTFYDGLSTRQSVRAETITNIVSKSEPFSANIYSSTINSDGFLTIGPESRVVNLGSRKVGGTTTEVNIGLKTLLYFDGISNVVVQKITETASFSPSNVESLPTRLAENELESSYKPSSYHSSSINPTELQPSYVSASDFIPSEPDDDATPEISLDNTIENAGETSKPRVRILTSLVRRPSYSLRSRVFRPRPGVVVRVRPGPSRNKERPESGKSVTYAETSQSPELASSLSYSEESDIVENSPLSLLSSSINTVSSRYDSNDDVEEGIDISDEVLATPALSLSTDVNLNIVNTDKIQNDLEETPDVVDAASKQGRPTRKRLTVTVRRPFGAGRISRTNTRFVLPSKLDITTRPRYYVVTRTGPRGVVAPSRRPYSVKVSRRLRPAISTEELESSGPVTVHYETYTTFTSVPVIFGLETSFRSVLLTASSPVVAPQDSPHFILDTATIQPTETILVTFYTTTTFTVPYTVGSQTLFTTVEQTNSRVVTQTYDQPDDIGYPISSRDSSGISSFLPSTSVELGFGGPTTHVVSSGNDGSEATTILYPGPVGGIAGIKVISTAADGFAVTSVNGVVPRVISDYQSTRQTLPPVQVVASQQETVEQVSRSLVTRVSDGVTLIVADGVTTGYKSEDSSPVTLQPTLVTDVVFMKDKAPSYSVVFDTRTLYTTYTFFTTLFSDTTSIISSSEQVVSSVITVPVTRPALADTFSPTDIPAVSPTPSVILETSERLVTSTVYSTSTFYATLFNGTSSFVSPIEDVRSDVYTITELITITKSVKSESEDELTPSSTVSSPSIYSTFTDYTTFTNYVTLFQGDSSIISSLEEITSNVYTFTLPVLRPSTSVPTVSSKDVRPLVTVYTTRTLFTTDTHYITLFRGTETVLSSIEEIGSKLLTETLLRPFSDSSSYTGVVTSVVTESVSPELRTSINASRTVPDEVTEETPTVRLVSSLQKFLTTFTYFTTLVSGPNTIISTRQEVSTSYITLFVPYTSHLSSTLETETLSITPVITYVTSTEFTTYTFYTTLFSGEDKVTISSEQVIPRVITETITITPTSSTSIEPVSTTEDIVSKPVSDMDNTLTFFTTYTYYTTFVHGDNTVVSSSLRAVTQYVTVEPTSSSDSSILHTPTVSSDIEVPESSVDDATSTATVIATSSVVPTASEHEEISIVTIVSSKVSTSTATKLPEEELTRTSVVVNIGSSTAVESSINLETTIAVETRVAVNTKVSSKINTDSPQQEVVQVNTSDLEKEKVDTTSALESSVNLIVLSSVDESQAPVFSSVLPESSVTVDREVTEATLTSIHSTPSILSGTSTTVVDGSTVIFFTDFILPGVVLSSSTTSDVGDFTSEIISPSSEEGPESSDLVSETPGTLLSSDILPLTSAVVLSEETIFIGLNNITTSVSPNVTLYVVTGIDGEETRFTEVESTSHTAPITPTETHLIPDSEGPEGDSDIKPGSVIELSDLLGGNANIGNNLAEAVKGIVHLFAGSVKNNTKEIKATDISKPVPLPPTEGVTVSNAEEPIYIPIGAIGKTIKPSQPAPVYPGTEIPIERLEEVSVTESKPSDYELPSSIFTSKDNVQPRVPVVTDIFKPGILITGFTPLSESVITKVASIIPSVKTEVLTGVRTVFIQPTEVSVAEQSDDVSSVKENLSEEVTESTVPVFSDTLTTLVVQPSLNSRKFNIEPTIRTSVIVGAKTVFLGSPTGRQPDQDTNEDSTIVDVPGLEPSTESSTFVNVQTVFTNDDSGKLSASDKNSQTLRILALDSATSSTPSLPVAIPSGSESYTTQIKDGQTIIGKTSVGEETIFFPSTTETSEITVSSSVHQEEHNSVKNLTEINTRYVTSVESTTRTLTLTTTKIYYTRDSPLTITSVFTTTIPPRTFVSTIIGSRTILGSLPEPTEAVRLDLSSMPSESTTTVTTTTLVFNSITTTVVRTLVIPTRAVRPTGTTIPSVLSVGTETPPEPPESADSKSDSDSRNQLSGNRLFSFSSGSRDQLELKKQPTSDPPTSNINYTVVHNTIPSFHPPTPNQRSSYSRQHGILPTSPTPRSEENVRGQGIGRPEIDGCFPACDEDNKETCKRTKNMWSCQCKPGYSRKKGSQFCEATKSYVVLLRVVKMGRNSVSYNSSLSNTNSPEYRNFAHMVQQGIDLAYAASEVQPNYVRADVNGFTNTTEVSSQGLPREGLLVNLTVSVNRNSAVDDKLLKDELIRSLRTSDNRVGGTDLFVSSFVQPVEDVRDFDECSNENYNDCADSAICTNLPGTYTCSCKKHYDDLDPELPGRVCSGEISSCEYCNGRGDCMITDEGYRICRCHHMYLGRRCEVNGLVLAVVLPIAVVVVILLTCCVCWCCRRWRRRRQTRAKTKSMMRAMGLTNSTPVDGTLDRKIMIIDSSSDSSGEHGPRPPYAFDGPYQPESGDLTPKKSSKRSELSLDRSLSTGFTVPPVAIPRAIHRHPKQVNYAVYNGQVFVW